MKISIAIPVYDMPNKEYFLKRCMRSIERQTFKDYEIVITENGKGMASNTNEAMRKCKGAWIKILYMDDYLAHPDALQKIWEQIEKKNFEVAWLASACMHDDGKNIYHKHSPKWNDDIHKGVNTIGSPSVITIKNGLDMYFDENLMWMLDCDLYKRIEEKYGGPVIISDVNVIIGIGEHQATNWMGEERKKSEEAYMKKKYAKND